MGLLVGLALAGNAGAQSLEQVTLQLKWRHQFQFAGYYAAIEQGYYREAGLEVVLREAEPEENPVQAVLDGTAEFGVGNSDLLLTRAAGEPVVVLAAVFQHSPLLLVVRAASGVDTLQGLHDRQMMMIESEKAELLAYFRHEGIDVSRLQIRPHTLQISDFIEGRVDAMSAYSTDQPFELMKAGVAFHAFTARSGGIDFYGDNLFTTQEQIDRHPERVRAFREASLRGWEYALAHPEEVIDLILREYSQRNSRAHLEFEAGRTAELMHPGVIEAGHINPGRWRHISDTYADFGMLPRGFDLGGFLYDPDPQPDLRWFYWSLGGLGLLTVGALGWALPLFRLNRRLRQEVAIRRRAEDELRIAKEAAESANQAKTRYLAVISHEVRTPIAGIIGLVDMMRNEGLNASDAETLRLIESSAEELLKLIGELLDHSRIEEGRMEVENVAVPVRQLLGETCDLFRGSAKAKNLEFSMSVNDAVPEVIMSDPLRLKQILGNLLSNAIKFTSSGAVTVAVTPRLSPSRQTLIRIDVSDTGIGIAENQLDRLFQPYSQADETIARRFGGSGLGLSISRQLAGLLGGGIEVRSKPGEGTTFTVELPTDVVDAPRRTTPAS